MRLEFKLRRKFYDMYKDWRSQTHSFFHVFFKANSRDVRALTSKTRGLRFHTRVAHSFPSQPGCPDRVLYRRLGKVIQRGRGNRHHPHINLAPPPHQKRKELGINPLPGKVGSNLLWTRVHASRHPEDKILTDKA